MRHGKTGNYLERSRKALCSGKLVWWEDKRFRGYRYFWLDIPTGDIYELNCFYVDSYRHMWKRFSRKTEFTIRAGHVVDNWNYELPF